MFHTMAKYQQKLEREQLILRAFVDIGTELFAMAAVLSRAEQMLHKQEVDGDTLQQLVDYICTRARQRIRDNFQAVKRNPGRLVNPVAEAFMKGRYAWLTEGIYTQFPPTFVSAEKISKAEAMASPEEEHARR